MSDRNLTKRGPEILLLFVFCLDEYAAINKEMKQWRHVYQDYDVGTGTLSSSNKDGLLGK